VGPDRILAAHPPFAQALTWATNTWTSFYGGSGGEWLVVTGPYDCDMPPELPVVITTGRGAKTASPVTLRLLGTPLECLQNIREWISVTTPPDGTFKPNTGPPTLRILADRIGVHKSSVSGWIQGLYQFRPDRLDPASAREFARLAAQAADWQAER
jgi:hypothetical protein